jgi:hypothetical protein
MKSSWYSLIPFLSLFCNRQLRRLDSIQFQAHIPAGWRPETRLFSSRLLDYCSIYLVTSGQSQSHIPTDGQSISKSWCRAPCGAHDQILFDSYGLSDERTGLSFVYGAGPCHWPFWPCPFINPRHGPHRKHSFYCWRGVFTAPLPSNRRPIFPRVCFCGNVFSESLSSNG